MLHKKFINARNVGEQAKQLVPQSMLSIFWGPQNKIERVIKKGGGGERVVVTESVKSRDTHNRPA